MNDIGNDAQKRVMIRTVGVEKVRRVKGVQRWPDGDRDFNISCCCLKRFHGGSGVGLLTPKKASRKMTTVI